MRSPSTVSAGKLLSEDGQRIAYDHYDKSRSSVIVIAHGFFNSKRAVVLRQLAQAFWEDHDVFLFDFRGHGQSSGLFTWTSKEGQDLAAVLNHLRPKYQNIGLVGFSFGGSIAINALSKDKRVDSFICVSAPAFARKIDYRFWELDLQKDLFYTLLSREGRQGKGVRPGPFWLKTEDPVNNISKLTVPIFFIHGTKDWVVKPGHSQALYDRAKGDKEIFYVQGGRHGEFLMKDEPQLFVRKAQDWFQRTLA